MKSASVRLYLRVRRSDGSRVFVQPAFASNGRLRPQFALVEGQPRHCPGAVYYLRYAAGGRRVWEDVGSDPQLALLAKERVAAARAAGIAMVEDKTAEAYRETLRGVAGNTAAKYLEDLGRREVLRYIQHLRDRGNAPRTIHNRLVFLRTFLRSHHLAMPIAKGDWPKYTEKVVSCYRADELRALLQAADQGERDMVNFFLATGGRKQEVQFAAWSDIDWQARTLTVREKLDLGFRPKDREEGSIPLPDFLLALLRERPCSLHSNSDAAPSP